MKKVFALVLSLALCLSLLPAAFAAEDETYLITITTADGVVTSGYRESWRWVALSRTDPGRPGIPLTNHSRDTGYVNGPELKRSDEGSATCPTTQEELITWGKALDGTPLVLTMGEESWEGIARYMDQSTPQVPDGEKALYVEFPLSEDGSHYIQPDSDTLTLFRYDWEQEAADKYTAALNALIHAEGYVTDQQLEALRSTIVLRHKEVPAAGENPAYKDYELYLVSELAYYKTDPAQRLLLPSTTLVGDYAPTDQAPDSMTISEDSYTLTYTYSFDSPLARPDGEILHEAGTYTYTVAVLTGEQSVIHSDEVRSPAQPPAEAPEEPPIRFFAQSQELAEKLKALWLFLGDENGNFNLDWGLTRTTALIMLIRTLGEEQQAKAAGKTHPFTDVPDWADGYVSWAYAKGYTNGVSATQFGANNTAGADMYLTFMLRALGYSDKDGEDFTWNSPYLTAREAGILPFETNCLNFTRADAVLVTSAALFAPEKSRRFETLHEWLEQSGAFTAEQFKAAFPENPFAWEATVERKVDSALDKALGVGQADFKTARVQSHAILDVAQDGVLLTIHALVCDHSLTAEELRDGEFGDYFTSPYVIEMQKAYATPGTVLRCKRDEENVFYWDDPTVMLFRDELDAVAQKKMTDLIASGVVQFREPTYDEAVKDFLNSTSLLTVKETFESDYGTVFVWDVPNPHGNTGMMKFICKAGHPKGEGTVIDLPHPQHGIFNMVRPAASMELSGDKKTFTYSYHFDEPLGTGDGSRIIRPAGDFIYTLDLTTGEVTEKYIPLD